MQTHSSAPTATTLDPFAIGGGLLKNDLRLLPALFALLALPSVAEVLLAPHTGTSSALLLLFERLTQLTVMSAVVLRWRIRLTAAAPQRPHTAYLRTVGTIVGIGALLSLAYTGGFYLAVLASAFNATGDASARTDILPALLWVVGLGVALAGMVIALRLYFYYAVAGIIGGSWRTVIRGAATIAARAPSAALRALLAPCAWTALASSLCSLPFPDGRSLFWSVCASAMVGIFWLLSTYAGLAFALTLFHPAEWRAAGLEPYYLQRLETLAAQGRAPFGEVLRPRTALKVLCLTALTGIAVLYRFSIQPSSIQLEVLSIGVEEQLLQVRVRATDPAHQLRSFHPSLLTVRGEKGAPVSLSITSIEGPTGAHDTGAGSPPHTPRGSEPLEVTVTFRTDRKAEELRALTDLWVWYGFEKRVYVSPLLARQLEDVNKDGDSSLVRDGG